MSVTSKVGTSGGVAERLGRGLQSPVVRFDSGRRLQMTLRSGPAMPTLRPFRGLRVGTLPIVALLALGVIGETQLSAFAVGSPVRHSPVASLAIAPKSVAPVVPQPDSSLAALTKRLTPLWSAVSTGHLAVANGLFYPETAYVALKVGRISQPQTDWLHRLWAYYELDLSAYQHFVGAGSSFKLLRVAPGAVSYIARGVCENNSGYWHLANLRLVFSGKNGLRSFAVASLISWNGEWFIVHLGPNPRSAHGGQVALPGTGTTPAGPVGGC